MTVKWTGFDFGPLEAHFHVVTDEIIADATSIMEDVVNFALEEMVRILEAAETKTGQARAALYGGHPGRVKTAQMSADITYALENDLGEDVVGEWGWIDNVQDYYLHQEYGTSGSGTHPGVPAMSALQQSYVRAREMLRDRLSALGEGHMN